ncbi:hypothetical protein NDU88_001321 [Pleurodeles waltl]|uniref:Uncharacterized protein n=1 Tax=Pleurodeles waltl TaxID=8319 RepID=A0AAV7R7J3_PLEWA|nr:hypothetical protein NDU88_001321 [Pleurodeles waltl]
MKDAKEADFMLISFILATRNKAHEQPAGRNTALSSRLCLSAAPPPDVTTVLVTDWSWRHEASKHRRQTSSVPPASCVNSRTTLPNTNFYDCGTQIIWGGVLGGDHGHRDIGAPGYSVDRGDAHNNLQWLGPRLTVTEKCLLGGLPAMGSDSLFSRHSTGPNGAQQPVGVAPGGLSFASTSAMVRDTLPTKATKQKIDRFAKQITLAKDTGVAGCDA